MVGGARGRPGRGALAAVRRRAAGQRGDHDFLAWCCEQLAADGKTALLLVWDNASWHVSREVRAWIADHNRAGQGGAAGVRIVACPLPIKSPWLNPIEPKWVHGKKRVIEPARLLTAAELEERVYRALGADHADHLSMPKKAA